MPEPTPERQTTPLENMLRTGGVGGVLALLAYGAVQRWVLPPIHAAFLVDGVDTWVVTALDWTLPSSVAMGALGAAAWLGTHFRNAAAAAEKYAEGLAGAKQLASEMGITPRELPDALGVNRTLPPPTPGAVATAIAKVAP